MFWSSFDGSDPLPGRHAPDLPETRLPVSRVSAVETCCVLARRPQAIPQWMCSASSGTTTQPCLRSSQTETCGGGKAGSAKAPTGIAIRSSESPRYRRRWHRIADRS